MKRNSCELSLGMKQFVVAVPSPDISTNLVPPDKLPYNFQEQVIEDKYTRDMMRGFLLF